MGQQQGLVVMYGIAAVAVLFAVAAALGAFDGPAPKTSGAAGGTNANVDGPGGKSAAVPKDSSKAIQLLLGSVQHYADLLASGQKIVGHTHYADIASYGRAFTDPKSAAAEFAKFRTSPNPEADVSYLDVKGKAAAAYGGDHGDVLDKWSHDMAKVKSDLGAWVGAAAQYQQGAVKQAALDAAAGTVTQDLAAAKADAASLSG
jgi:hypothetical protein